MSCKGPGKHFRKGITYVELIQMFPDDAAAEAWFIRNRWPDGVRCPKCNSDNIQERRTRKPQPYRCRSCRKDFSVKTNTLMHSSPLGFQVWAIAIFLSATHLKGLSSMKLHRDLGVTQKTAWHLAHRIREAWKNEVDPFIGPVEVDETYVGGKRKNMHKHKRKELTGRGSVGKVAVAGAKDRATGKMSARMVRTTDSRTLQDFVQYHTKPGATVFTDEARAYQGMKGVSHETVNHGMGEYVCNVTHTNGIESFWSMLKRAYQGTFHHISPKHLKRYINEFAGRHNVRCLDTINIMARIVMGMADKRLRYEVLIA